MPSDNEVRPDDEPRARLAARLGLALEVEGPDGERARVPRETLIELLKALGYDASNEARAHACLAGFDVETRPLIEPVRLMTRSSVRSQELDVDLGAQGAREVSWTIDLRTEDGTRSSRHGHVRLRDSRRFALPYPRQVPLGYHELSLTVTTGNNRWFGEQRWIVVPDGCHAVDTVIDGRAFGVCLHVHALRSERSWGAGDLTDLRLLTHSLGAAGADFVALGPLHALANRWPDVNPYAPISRLFRNPLCIDVEAVPELDECDDTRAWLRSDRVRAKLDQLRAGELIDYDAVSSLKMQALRRLHRQFLRRHRRRDTPRGRAFDAFRAEQGPLLDAYAVYRALDDLMQAAEGQTDWRSWPAEYQRPDSAAVRDFAEMHGELVDFHRYLQFELDRQMAQTAAAARDAGLRLGFIHELAMGSAGGGFDTWAFRDLFALDVDLGHPFGPLRPDGGRWSLPPLLPDRLRAEGYGYWSRLLRNAFRHAGGLRIDHILGLMRQRWIARDRPDDAGTDLHPRSFDLFGILALESQRAGAVVIGEALGERPTSLEPTLARWQILSTRTLELELGTTQPQPGPRVQAALAIAASRDRPSLAAWWTSRDLAVRDELGTLDPRGGYDAANARRDAHRRALVRRLAADGLLATAAAMPSYQELVCAVHRFLARTPCQLVGVTLDDLLADTEPTYLLDVAPERFPSWCRRSPTAFASALADPGVLDALRAADRG